MAQHDYNIADQAGLAFLQDLNNMAGAIATLNSGATEPTTTYAGMFWLDTSGAKPVLKQRNQANTDWVPLSSLIDAEVMPSPTASGYVKRKADNSGNETKTAQQVADEIGPLIIPAAIAFHAHKNGTDQTGIPSATYTKITFGTEEFDVGSHYDVATSRYTPPVGKCLLTAVAQFAAGAGVVDTNSYGIAIYKNGTPYRYGQLIHASSTGSLSPSITCIAEANGTDYFEVYAYGAGAGTKTISGTINASYFSGARL